MAEFELHSEKLRVTGDYPWSFDKSLILMKEFDRVHQIKNIKMVKASFWIRVYNLPLMARNEYIGGLIENAMGDMEEIDLDHSEFE